MARGPVRLLIATLARQRVWSFALVALGVAALVTVLVPSTTDSLGPVAALVGTASASLAFLFKSRQCEARERAAWALFGTGFGSAAVGMLVIPITEMFGYEPPPFGWTDSFFLLSYVLVFVGLAALPHGERSRLGRLLDIADGLVGAVSIATLSWTWFFSAYLERFDDAPMINRILGFAYPVLDVAAVIVVMMLCVRRSDRRFDTRLLVFGVGMTIQAVADLTFVNSATGTSFADVQPIYAIFIAASMCYLLTATLTELRPARRETSDEPRARWVMVAPYGMATVMLAALIDSTWGSDHHDARILTLSSVVVAAIIIGRQAAAIRENAVSVERQRQSLVSTVSHELRTPLTALYGLLEILSTDPSLSVEERTEFIDIAAQQARYMGRVVSDLITLTRGGDELTSVNPSTVDIHDVIAQAVSQADRRGSVDIVVAPTMVRVDPDRMMQAISNLVTNANKYGGTEVSIRTRLDKGLTLEVHDNGPGVPPKHQLRIWHQFERGAHQFDGRTPGSGIGLAIVSAVARAHGGSAGYKDSELLGGACFFIALPAATLSTPGPATGANPFPQVPIAAGSP